MRIFEGTYSGKDIFKMAEDIEGCFDTTLNDAFNSITPKGKDYPQGEFTVVVKWHEKVPPKECPAFCPTCKELVKEGWDRVVDCPTCHGIGRV